MNKLLLILGALGITGGGVWWLTKRDEAGCVMGVTECCGGDLYVCEPVLHQEGEIGTRLTLLQANSLYCSSDGPRGSIYGVTITQQEEPVAGALVMVVNHAILGAWLSQWSKCPAAPGARVSRGLGVQLTDAQRRLRHPAGPLPPRGTGQRVGALPECFRFDNLPVGTYTVLCFHTGYITSEEQAIVTEGQETFVVGLMVAE